MRKIQSQGGNDTNLEKGSDNSMQVNLKKVSVMVSWFTLPIVGIN